MLCEFSCKLLSHLYLVLNHVKSLFKALHDITITPIASLLTLTLLDITLEIAARTHTPANSNASHTPAGNRASITS